jgi:hypothetical protein
MKTNGKKDNAMTKKNDDLFGLKVGFTPLFSSAHAIQLDDTGVPIKGTGLLIYQGYSFTILDWVDEKSGELKTAECTKHVFAVKGSDGTWKCIDITMSKWNEGNLYDRFLKKMGLDNILTEIDDVDQIPGFLKNYVPNQSLIDERLEKMRGMGFLATLERKTKKHGAKIYDIEIDTIEPLLIGNDEHKRLQSAESTDPRAKTIYSLEGAE